MTATAALPAKPGEGLTLRHEPGRAVTLSTARGVLLRYVYAPATPAGESPRPYAHPVNSLAGDTLTNFRPNDHPWHHGLSLTLASVGGVNFWGGPTYQPADGYRWRDDHGGQIHQAWLELTPGRLRHTLAWRTGGTGEVLLSETRTLSVAIAGENWALDWESELVNATARPLALEHYQSAGLAGSHYTGLQFRGARGFLDEHGDEAIRLGSEGGHDGEAAVHGTPARWMEWRGQMDESLRRVTIRFENLDGPIPWFVRRGYPLAAFCPRLGSGPPLAPGGTLTLRHRLGFLQT
jgi:hypothetical protein